MLALPMVAVAVLAVEVQLARGGDQLPASSIELDGLVGRGKPAGPGESGKPRPVRMVWLGDSTAAGVGASTAAGSLPHQVAGGIGQPVELTVLAESGARVADVVTRQLPAVAPLEPDLVLVSVGANDTTGLTSTADFRRRYELLLRTLQGLPRFEVVVLGVPDMGSPPRLAQPLRAIAGWRGRRLDREVRAAAAEHDARYVDIAGETGPEFRRHPGRSFAADRYHPADEGYRLWAEAVLQAVRS